MTKWLKRNWPLFAIVVVGIATALAIHFKQAPKIQARQQAAEKCERERATYWSEYEDCVKVYEQHRQCIEDLHFCRADCLDVK